MGCSGTPKGPPGKGWDPRRIFPELKEELKEGVTLMVKRKKGIQSTLGWLKKSHRRVGNRRGKMSNATMLFGHIEKREH